MISPGKPLAYMEILLHINGQLSRTFSAKTLRTPLPQPVTSRAILTNQRPERRRVFITSDLESRVRHMEIIPVIGLCFNYEIFISAGT